MSRTLNKVRKGERFGQQLNADTWNSFIDAAQANKNKEGRSFNRSNLVAQQEAGLIVVKNASGLDLGRFDIVGIDDPMFTPTDNLAEFKNRLQFSCSTPDIEYHLGKFAILQEPLANGKLGIALVSGLAVCKVNVSDASHEWADVEDGETTRLESRHDDSAGQILWKESGTGDKWAVIRVSNLQTVNMWRFTLNEDMSANKADADILEMDGTDTTTDADVEDPASFFPRALDGAKGLAMQVGGVYYVIECEQEATAYLGDQVGALLTSDTTNGIDGLVALNGQATASASITAQNTFA